MSVSGGRDCQREFVFGSSVLEINTSCLSPATPGARYISLLPCVAPFRGAWRKVLIRKWHLQSAHNFDDEHPGAKRHLWIYNSLLRESERMREKEREKLSKRKNQILVVFPAFVGLNGSNNVAVAVVVLLLF